MVAVKTTKTVGGEEAPKTRRKTKKVVEALVIKKVSAK